MKYAIGLDVGISSVGYALVGLNGTEEPCGIVRMGSRVFDKAEQPKTGESLAAPRREARSTRRRLRRHRHRIQRVRDLFVRSGLLSQQELDSLYDAANLEDIYELRVKALDKAVSKRQFARILLHLAQRRGFKSNRRDEASDKEQGKLLKAVAANKALMDANNYRTAGEMFYNDPLFAERKRNKDDSYLATIHRDMVESEAKQIFCAQRGLANDFATLELENEYLSILLSQRSFDEGPGEGSPYAGDQIENMVGKCSMEPEERRAARACYSFEYFSLLEKVNHIRIQSSGSSRALSSEERRAVTALAHKTPELTYAKIRAELGIDPSARFNMLRYRSDKTPEETEKEKLNVMRAYHEIRKALDKVKKGRIKDLSVSQLNDIGSAFALYKTEARIRERIASAELSDYDVDALMTMASAPFSRFGHLSVAACDKIIPFLEQGMDYDKACSAAGYEFKGHGSLGKGLLLPATGDEMDSITSPVVRRAVSQTIKVINAIIREQGCSPLYINIELAREMSKDFRERTELDKAMKENSAENERIVKSLQELGVRSPTGQDIIKYRLWKEQDGVCAYSLKQIKLGQLFDAGYAEIDHIVPYSVSFDDSRNNKVLVFSEENRQKGNRLPLEYLTGKRRDDFIVYTKAAVKKQRKRQNLLKEKITDDDLAGFRERNLQDTKHMARFLYNYISDHLNFAESSTGKKRRVYAVNGGVTGHLRKRWGFTKLRADGDLHHAVDAAVIACATQKMVNDISRFYAREESRYVQSEDGAYSVNAKTGEVFPAPWVNFRADIVARTGDKASGVFSVGEQLSKLWNEGKLPSYACLPEIHLEDTAPIFVSRMPRRKVSGAAHKETIKSAKALDDGVVVSKKPLTALKLDSNGEICGYYNPESDKLLYAALKARLAAFDGNAQKAFSEPFYKPRRDGSQGPEVKKVKICEKSTLNVPTHGGTAVADNDSMVRIDVFHVEKDGYYFIPIYVADTLKDKLPNKAVVSNKPYDEWRTMDDSDFVFSLYPNDLIKVKHRSGITLKNKNEESSRAKERSTKEEFLYYIKAGISTASITAVDHEGVYAISSLGLKTLESVEKYQVDVLGGVSRVKKEKRQTFL